MAKKNGLTITGVVKGLARAHIRKVELLVGKGNKAQKVSTASITIKQRGSKKETEISARIQPSKDTSYTLSWRVTAANGATVEGHRSPCPHVAASPVTAAGAGARWSLLLARAGRRGARCRRSGPGC